VSVPFDPLTIARDALQQLRSEPDGEQTDCDVSEESEERSAGRMWTARSDDPFVEWRLGNAAQLSASDLAAGRDPGGFCVEHRRCLSYPEQKRGACSWCVPVTPEREPEYWASHWRRYTEGQ
jgi:hypothetical protein